MRLRTALLLPVLASVACGGTSCLMGRPESPDWQFQQDTDGTRCRVVTRETQTTWYRMDGSLQKVLLDTNRDGRPDLWAYHLGDPKPKRIEIDVDYDGEADRFEELAPDGSLRRVGFREGRGRRFATPGADGLPVLVEHDSDGDGRIDRTERLERGSPVAIEIDGDRDGRVDRWQRFSGRRLTSEELDTDADGKPDRRLRYDAQGELEGIESIR